jgi:hypothetical protein
VRRFILAALAASIAVPALADQTEGVVEAYDRVSHVIVLTDKTVWQMPGDLSVPADMGRGDRVLIEFTSAGENGITGIRGLTRLAVAVPGSTRSGS